MANDSHGYEPHTMFRGESKGVGGSGCSEVIIARQTTVRHYYCMQSCSMLPNFTPTELADLYSVSF